MRLYLGSHGYKPVGFLTVDVDPKHTPDIIGDVTKLNKILDNSVDEICASHILEHLAWPYSFAALCEWTRVLRDGGRMCIAVPDLSLLARLISEGRNVWGATGLLFGVGRLENPLEAHQYAYTRDMLLEMLRTLGFSDFEWWHHDFPDASNGWIGDDAGDRIAISLNVAATKTHRPICDAEALLQLLMNERLKPFGKMVSQLIGSEVGECSMLVEGDAILVQRLHMELIEARMRILYLEAELKQKDERSER